MKNFLPSLTNWTSWRQHHGSSCLWLRPSGCESWKAVLLGGLLILGLTEAVLGAATETPLVALQADATAGDLQFALDHARNEGNSGVVRLACGTFDTGDGLLIPPSVALLGSGHCTVLTIIEDQAAVLRNTNGWSGDAIDSTIRIENLRITGHNASVGIDLRYTNRARIRDVWITDCQKGILLGKRAWHTVVEDVTMSPNSKGESIVGIEVFGLFNGSLGGDTRANENSIVRGAITGFQKGIRINYASKTNIYGTEASGMLQLSGGAPGIGIHVGKGTYATRILFPRLEAGAANMTAILVEEAARVHIVGMYATGTNLVNTILPPANGDSNDFVQWHKNSKRGSPPNGTWWVSYGDTWIGP